MLWQILCFSDMYHGDTIAFWTSNYGNTMFLLRLLTFMHLVDKHKSHVLHVILHILSNAVDHLILCAYCMHTANTGGCAFTNITECNASYILHNFLRWIIVIWSLNKSSTVMWFLIVRAGFYLKHSPINLRLLPPSTVACVPGDCAIRKNSQK